MRTAKIHDRGRRIRFLQIALNTHLNHSPKLRPDGVFGHRTLDRVKVFQKYAGLAEDGIVGPLTWGQLQRPARPPSPGLKKFYNEVGTVSDFVSHVRTLEGVHRTQEEVFQALTTFFNTPTNARYLLSSQEPYIIDFRHFFAAAAEAFSGALSTPGGLPIGGSRGEALLLGLANEVLQCVDEGLKSKLNSCFSAEDLGSNRLGADFGRAAKVARAEASRTPLHAQLQEFLRARDPKAPIYLDRTELPGPGQVAGESLQAIVTGLMDLLVPDAL